MIILEGPDGSGKTTVIKRLGLERRSFKALRGGLGEDERGNWGALDPAPIAYARQILRVLDEEQALPPGVFGPGASLAQLRWPNVAFDRFHLSETIYGPILRQKSGISDVEVVVLERLLKARGVMTVLCLPPALETFRNVKKEGRSRPDYQTLGFLCRSYRAWEQLASERYDLKLDYTEPNFQPLDRRVLRPRPTCPPDVVGSPTARFLLIGERSNLALDLPFFSMQNSSGFLNRSLWYAGFREEEIAFTNAQTSEGRPRDLRACLLATTTHVIALGMVASSAAVAQGLAPVYTVPHPQFWQRFHARQEDRYVQHLNDVRQA